MARAIVDAALSFYDGDASDDDVAVLAVREPAA